MSGLDFHKGYPLSSSGTPDAVFLSSNIDPAGIIHEAA